MRRKFFCSIFGYLMIAVLTFGIVFSFDFHDTYAAYTRYVTASSLNIRKKASMSGAVVGSYKKGTKVTCYGTSGSWTKVKYNGATRYVSTSYLSSKKPSAVQAARIHVMLLQAP